MTSVFESAKTGLKCSIRVQPNASHNKIHDIVETAECEKRLKISVTATPENGKANQAVIKLLSKQWKIPKSQISVISGQTVRNKTVLLEIGQEEQDGLFAEFDI